MLRFDQFIVDRNHHALLSVLSAIVKRCVSSFTCRGVAVRIPPAAVFAERVGSLLWVLKVFTELFLGIRIEVLGNLHGSEDKPSGSWKNAKAKRQNEQESFQAPCHMKSCNITWTWRLKLCSSLAISRYLSIELIFLTFPGFGLLARYRTVVCWVMLLVVILRKVISQDRNPGLLDLPILHVFSSE